jgi:hypothetical protein
MFIMNESQVLGGFAQKPVSEILNPGENKAPWGQEAGTPQRATPGIGNLWSIHWKTGRFWAQPPTARQIENWQPVVYLPGKNAVLGHDPPLWRAVVI